jgi:hypothetical protein
MDRRRRRVPAQRAARCRHQFAFLRVNFSQQPVVAAEHEFARTAFVQDRRKDVGADVQRDSGRDEQVVGGGEGVDAALNRRGVISRTENVG